MEDQRLVLKGGALGAGRAPHPVPGAIITVAGLSRSFVSESETVWAVREVNLTVRAGEFLCIFGASGSGKSTFLNLLAGLDSPDTGRVVVDGVDVVGLSEDRRARLRLQTIGVVFEDDNLIDEFTAVENVALPLEVLRIAPELVTDEAEKQLARVGLAGLEDRLPRRLSRGQRQRVGIARALAGGRRILVADEPTGALDVENSAALFTLLRELCDQGTTVVVASHDVAIRPYADTIYEMVDGDLTRRTPEAATTE